MRGSMRNGRASLGLVSVFVLVMLVLLASAGVAFAFSDVPGGHPYAAAIADLSGRQIVSGYDDGTFGPENPTTRQQFAKMIVLSLGLRPSEADVCPFTDVDISGPGSLYPDNYIAVAAANSITEGTGSGLFSPERRITRAQVVTMVVRALDRLEPGTLAPTPGGYEGTWGDFSLDHAAFAAKAESNGLLAGLGADASHPLGDLAALDPFGEMPRGEVAQVLHNLLVKLAPPTPPPTGYPAIHAPDAALSATYAACAGSSCHETNIYSQHVDKLGFGCSVCHGSSRPEVTGAIAAYGQTGAKQGCRVCHGQDAGTHAASHELDNPVPSACTLCHAPNLVAEHVTKNQLSCAVCHGPAAPAAVAAVVASFAGSNPRNPVCADCHSSSHAGLAAAHTATETAECQGCHQMVLSTEHARSSSSTKAGGCASCHPLASAFSWAGSCGECHEPGGLAPARHSAIESVHVSASACATAGCHISDLRVVHQNTPNGCRTCHDSTSVPKSAQCTSCHATSHPGLAAAHTEQEAAECQGCHLMVLPDEHARSTSSSKAAGCQNCHPLLGSFASTNKCADCHKAGGAAPARHSSIDSVHVGSGSCGGAGCHSTDLRTLHQNTPNGCKTCHSTSSVPTTKTCSSCHPTTPHTVREPYRDSCANCHDIGGPSESLHKKHVNDGFACAECHGDSAPGCANGSCHKHSVSQIHGVGDHPDDCLYCHKSGTP